MTHLINNSVYKILLPVLFTAAILVASFSVGGKPVQAQTAAQTVADLLDGVSIPGLDSLPVSNLQSTDSHKSVDITVHGQTATLVVFKPTGADTNVVAVIPDNFSLSDFVPLPSGTPLDDVTFSDMAFIIAQGNVSLVKADAPTPLSAALSHGGDTVILKQGVNIFGQADFTASDTVSSVLSAVGITDLTLPLNGGFPTSLFSQNPKTAAADFKNEILDNMDIALPLPGLSGLGLPSNVNIKDTRPAHHVQNDAGTRTFEVDVKGELNVTVASKTLNFDFDVDVQKPAGKPVTISISGVEDPNTTVTVSLLHDFTLTNLTFNMNKSSGKWVWDVSGDTTWNNATVNADFVIDPVNGNFMNLNTSQTLAQLMDVSSNLPGLDDVVLDVIQLRKQEWFLQATIKGIETNIMLFKQDGIDKHYISVQFGIVSPATFIPGAENTPLKDVDFQGLNFLYSPATTKQAVANATLPDQVVPWVAHGGADAEIKPGLNIYGVFSVHPTGEMATLLQKVGITDLGLPLKGVFSPSVFKGGKKPTAKIKNEILKNLDLKLPIPKINVPGISKIANIQHSTLAIKGENKNGTRSIDIKIVGELDVSIRDSKLTLDYSAEVTKPQGKPAEISISAHQAQNDPFDINLVETFSVTDLDFQLKKGDKYLWTLSGNTTFRSKTVNIMFVHNPDADGQFLYVNAQMKLSDIAGESLALPGLDDVMLENIQVWHNKFVVEAKVRDKNIWVTAFKVSGYSKPYVFVQIGKISPSKIIPGAEKTPLKDVDFDNLAFLYSPASTEKKASESKLIPGVAGGLLIAGSDVTIKQGLNIYGTLSVHPTGEMATLLQKVGISDLELPLNGGFSTKAFSTDISAVKKAILDNLDLNIPLPTPSIPGLDKALTFNNGKMHISGTLPDGSQGISVEVSGDADVHLGSDSVDFAVDVTFDRASGGGETELKITGTTTTPWNDPFGMTWIDLTNLGVTFDETTTNGQKEWNVAVNANSTIGHHSNLDVTVNIREDNGNLTYATFTLDGPLDLSEVPGIKDIPEVNDLTINTLTASSRGIEARTTFQGKETDFFAFEDNDKWVIALSQNNLMLTEIIPPLAATPLKDIVLSEAAIVVTQAQVNGVYSSFGPVARAAFTEIYHNAPDPEISIAQGLNLIAAFEDSKSTGTMKKGMKKLGMSEERVILTGDIGGIMGDSNPHVNLNVKLSQHGRPHNMPKWMNFADKTEFIFSIYGSNAGDDPVVEVGIGFDIITRINDDNLIFEGKMGLEFQEEAVTLKFVMDLKNGNINDGLSASGGLNCTLKKTPKHSAPRGPAGWHRPFGIPGFTLYNVAMDVGIDEDGAIHLGFAGGAKVGGDRFCVAADADLLPEAEGAPQDIAFVGAADMVESDFLENLAIQVATDLAKGNSTTAGIVSKFPISDITTIMEGMPQPEYKSVIFAFVTPGASDPKLNIQGEGVALKGDLYWLGKTLGSIDMAVGPKTGIKIGGSIGKPIPNAPKGKPKVGDLTIGPLSFKNTKLDFKIPIPPKNPLDGYFKLNAKLTIPVVGVTEKIHADLTNKGMSFSVTNTILSDFSETLTLALTGVNLSVAQPDMSNADFAISGSLQADFGTFIKTALSNTMTALFAELNQTLLDGEKAVKAAKKKVAGLNKKINHERAIVRAERAKVEAKLKTAQTRVDTIKADLKHDWKKYHHCHGWKKWWCKAKWGVTIGVEKGVKDVADAILEAIEDLVAHIPIDFDPRVWPLIAAKDVAVTALNVALLSIEGLDDLDNLSTKGLNEIANFVGGSVNLKKASFNGDIGDIIKSDAPVDLNIDIELFGSDFSDTFAFKLGDAKNELKNLGKAGAKDSAHLALLAYVAADHLFNKVLSDIPDVFKMQLSRSIGSRIETTQTALRTELATYKTDFQKYHKTAQAIQANYAGFADSYSAALLHKRVTMLDKEPASKTFTDAQLELGATGICLTGAYGSFMFKGCAIKGEYDYRGSYTRRRKFQPRPCYTPQAKIMATPPATSRSMVVVDT